MKFSNVVPIRSHTRSYHVRINVSNFWGWKALLSPFEVKNAILPY